MVRWRKELTELPEGVETSCLVERLYKPSHKPEIRVVYWHLDKKVSDKPKRKQTSFSCQKYGVAGALERANALSKFIEENRQYPRDLLKTRRRRGIDVPSNVSWHEVLRKELSEGSTVEAKSEALVALETSVLMNHEEELNETTEFWEQKYPKEVHDWLEGKGEIKMNDIVARGTIDILKSICTKYKDKNTESQFRNVTNHIIPRTNLEFPELGLEAESPLLTSSLKNGLSNQFVTQKQNSQERDYPMELPEHHQIPETSANHGFLQGDQKTVATFPMSASPSTATGSPLDDAAADDLFSSMEREFLICWNRKQEERRNDVLSGSYLLDVSLRSRETKNPLESLNVESEELEIPEPDILDHHFVSSGSETTNSL